jgi:hypothetical protein
MSVEENIAEVYLNKLQDDPNPVSLLVKFYSELFTLPYNAQLFGPITRLVKTFGRDAVFYSILSIENMDDLKHENIYPLLRFMCMKRLEKTKTGNEYVDLSDYIVAINKKSEKTRNTKLKVRNPFED